MMLIAAFLFAAQTAVVEPPPVVPTDLQALPPLNWKAPPQITAAIAGFVAEEVRAGRCGSLARPLELEFAVMVRADGIVRTVVPRAIDCPTVEQFGAGLVTRFARDNLRNPASGWYRAALTFAWEP